MRELCRVARTSEHVLPLLLENARSGLELLGAQEGGHGQRLGLRRARLHGLAMAILVAVIVAVIVVVVVVVMIVIVVVIMAMMMLMLAGSLLLLLLPGLQGPHLVHVVFHADAQALGVGLHVRLDGFDLFRRHLLPRHGHHHRGGHGGDEEEKAKEANVFY